MKKILAVTFIVTSIILLFSCGKAQNNNIGDILMEQTYTIELEIENYGTITAVLDEKTAPVTVANFLKLVNEGFYNGLTFHRIINGFMMQGGCPEGTGMSGSGETIKGEFSANGHTNDIPHVRGVLSMARNGYDNNSASSQFFIVQSDESPHLDGQYAAFGCVTKGMDIVDKICKVTPSQAGSGSVLPANQPVIKEIRVVE